MTPLDALLVEAKSLAANYRNERRRIVAAREAVRLPRVEESEHGAAKVFAAVALRSLIRAMPLFADDRAQGLIAGALGDIADAIRAEPNRPQAAPAHERPDPRNLYWMERE